MELIMSKKLKKSGNLELDMIKMRVHELKNFYIHVLIYCIGVLIYIGKRYFNLPINFWPINFINEFFMWVWTFIVAVQGIKLFFKEMFFGAKWEQRKIKKLMDEEKSETTKWN